MSSGLIDWLADFPTKEPTNMKGYRASRVCFVHGLHRDINTGWTVCHAMALNESSTSPRHTRFKPWAEKKFAFNHLYML